jgi:hypothetical protein
MESRRKILWDPEPVASATVTETPTQTVVTIEATIPSAPTRRVRPAQTKTSGNGHTAAKTRELEEFERNKIETKLFIPNNGQIENDMCVEFKMKHLPDDVTIFQVTGYVTALHGRVRNGKLHLRNMEAYERFLRAHQSLWRTYESARYQNMKKLPPVNRHRKPRFAAVSSHR